MSWLLFSILGGLALLMLVRGLLVPGRFYHFPFFVAGIFVSFVLPQLPGVISNPFLPPRAVDKTLFFAIICLGACWAGWAIGRNSQGMRDFAFSERRLLHAAGAMSLLGAYFFYQFSQLPDEERLRGILTGTAVAYLFFAKLLTYGFAIALLCYARNPSKLALAIIVFGALFYLERIVIAGRRGETAEFFLLIALSLWFQRGWSVPRPAVVAGLALSLVGMLGAGEYRSATWYTEKSDWSSVLEIDLSDNWQQLLREGGPEMTNAVMVIDNIDRQKDFDFGVGHWNSTVFAYVPAQLVGQSFKDSLLIETPPYFERGYQPSVGSTWTGLADAFASFWYFGFVKFLILGGLLGWIYTAAVRGNTVMQIAYMLSAVPSMLAITHFTNEIVIAWIHLAAFMGLALLYARLPHGRTSAIAPGASQFSSVSIGQP